MERDSLSRRALLQALATALGTGVLTDARALAQALQRVRQSRPATQRFLSADEKADVDAITAQIIPTDDTPGAREAGVVEFIDRALATFLSHLGPDYRSQLAEFQAACRRAHPDVPSFASLGADQQIGFLKTVDHTPFFEATRLLTLLGMFSMPSYGGNRDGVGWKLIGLEAEHMFQPPFGYYDRDYQGYAFDPRSSK